MRVDVGNVFTEKNGAKVKVLAVVQGHAMVRRNTEKPFVVTEPELQAQFDAGVDEIKATYKAKKKAAKKPDPEPSPATEGSDDKSE